MKVDYDTIQNMQFNDITILGYNALSYEKKTNLEIVYQCGCGQIISSTFQNAQPDIMCKECMHERRGHGIFKNLAGQRFGKLTALYAESIREHSRGFLWFCVCDCGNIAITQSGHLISGNTKSCQHCHADELSEAAKIRRSSEYKVACQQCRERDKVCQVCGALRDEMAVHHLSGVHNNLDKACDIDNMIYLCKPCHRHYHHIYKYRFSDRWKFIEYQLWQGTESKMKEWTPYVNNATDNTDEQSADEEIGGDDIP